MTFQFLRRPGARLLAGFLFSLLVYILALHFGWFSTVDQKVYDLGLSLRSPSSVQADVVLVAIENRSVNECFPPPAFPVSRHLRQHAQIIERLDAAGADLIVFDVLIDSLGNVGPDEINRFTDVLERSGKVVLAGAIEKVALPDTRSGLVVTREQLCLPPENIRTFAKGFGLVNMPIDPDGCIRKCYLAKSFNNRSFLSLSHEAVRLYCKREKSLSSENTFYIDYASFGKVIRRIPYATVLRGDGWQPAVENKVVLVGVVENGSVDAYKVPISSPSGRLDGKMFGAEIQALAIQTLLSDTMILQASQTEIFGLGAIVLLILSFVLSRVRAITGFTVTFAVLILIIVGALISTAELSVVFPIGPLLLSLAGTALFMFTVNLTGLRSVTEIQEKFISDMKDDLDSAHMIYENLQPREFHLNDNVQISTMQIPCKEVGGDYYDIIPLSENRIGVLIADVSGKGVSGSLIMANLQGHFRHTAREVQSPAALLREFNESVAQVAASQARFVTLFYGVLDCTSLTLTYSNAGHCYPILCSSDGQARALTEGGPLLGPFPDLEWTDYNVTLINGDVLCLYTDGVTEAGGDEPQRQFGEERIITCLKERYKEPAEAIKSYIFEACKQFVGGQSFDDDLTLLVLKMGRV
jgi:CHASE2 domain-containing sensor protein